MESGTESKAIICESDDHNSFTVKTIHVKGPEEGQVKVAMKYATFSRHDLMQHAHCSHAQYPYLAGYDGVGTVEEIGAGVEEFEVGDHVAVFTVPGNYALSCKTNISDPHAQVLSSGKYWNASQHLAAYSDDNSIAGFRGLGTWSQKAVFPVANLTKINHEPEVHDAALGSVLATGLLGPSKVLKIEEGSAVAIFGSNSLALTLLAGVNRHKPSKVVVVGHKDDQELFESKGAIFIHDEGDERDVQKKLMDETADGYDYTFEATNFKRFGTVALEVCHKGWGKCALMTQSEDKDATVSTKPFQLVTGRHWIGSYMGNVNISKHHDELITAHNELTHDLAKHLFPEDHIVSVDDFPSKWEELSKTATYHRTVIQF